MPQKTIFTKYPLLSVPHSFLSCGLVRTKDPRVQRLYLRTQEFIESPSVWEGAFRLAAMLKDDPISEPVADRIAASLKESDDGSFSGRIGEQIAVARAALALFEYNTDRSILKRIASWCRYLEIEWDRIFSAGRTLFNPADLMEFLVRYYQAAGIKSVLRLCTKLRSAAFDWTTSLHTIQQVIRLESMDVEQISFTERIGTGELDYKQKQVLLNHAESVADGIRYSLYAGIFSGNRQDLTAGKTAWNYLRKHNKAICGGTTSGPFFSGNASNAPVGTSALAAWTEAFASQMLLSGSEWAVDELIRIVYNGLSRCLNADVLPKTQYVNSIHPNNEDTAEVALYARMSRAIAAAFSHGITVTEKGIKVNYTLEAGYIMMVRKQPVILQSDGRKILFGIKDEMSIPVDIYRSVTETAGICIESGDEKKTLPYVMNGEQTGKYLHIEKSWSSRDRICFDEEDAIVKEDTHHQGVCWFAGNRLMVYECTQDNYQIAAAGESSVSDGVVKAAVCRIDNWHLHHGEPDDIPVLPSHCNRRETIRLVQYDKAEMKISMFPRLNPLCLK